MGVKTFSSPVNFLCKANLIQKALDDELIEAIDHCVSVDYPGKLGKGRGAVDTFQS